MAAGVRGQSHAPGSCTYMVMRIINYTNVCVAQCDIARSIAARAGGRICALADRCSRRSMNCLRWVGTWRRSMEGSIRAAAELLLRAVCGDPGAVWGRVGVLCADDRRVHVPGRSCEAELCGGRGAVEGSGVRWITGGGSEILTEEFRARHSKFKYTVAQYFDAQRAIVEAGLKTTATMVIGFDETHRGAMEHLERTRQFQDETGGLASFLCWTSSLTSRRSAGSRFRRGVSAAPGAVPDLSGQYSADSDSVLTQNQRALEGLKYGADDFDLPIEDEVTQKAGATISLDFERILNYARELGYEPEYRHVSLGQPPWIGQS